MCVSQFKHNIPYHTWTQCLFVPVRSQPIFFINLYDPRSFVGAALAVAKKAEHRFKPRPLGCQCSALPVTS